MLAQNTMLTERKRPEQLLQINGNRIFSGQSPSWLAVVTSTVDFINTSIPKNENIFILPYDALYYFLTGRNCPVRQIILFEHLNITPKEESTLIEQLEAKNVNHILISNRAFYPMEPGLGVFGQDYCPFLKKYIDKNFSVIAIMGYFDQPAGWNEGHAIMILKRVSSQKTKP
jgi:hypothetical protein